MRSVLNDWYYKGFLCHIPLLIRPTLPILTIEVSLKANGLAHLRMVFKMFRLGLRSPGVSESSELTNVHWTVLNTM